MIMLLNNHLGIVLCALCYFMATKLYKLQSNQIIRRLDSTDK